MSRKDLVQVRRGSAASWTSVNPQLDAGEICYETDTKQIKIGDGSTWNATGYVTAAPGTVETGDIADNAVTNAKAAQMAANTIKGNNTGATANAVDLTRSQINAMVGLSITPEQFGAVGDFNPATYTGTDDAAAFNAMLAYARALTVNDHDAVPMFPNVAIRLRPGAIYRVNSTLNMTGFRAGLMIEGNDATIYSISINNQPVIDAIWSQRLVWSDLNVYAENGAYAGTFVQPSYGVVIGRKNNTDDCSGHEFNNVNVRGWFNNDAVYNIGAELTAWNKCSLFNSVVTSSANTGQAVHLSHDNEAGFSSAFQTMGTPWSFGMNENLFVQCNIQSAQGRPIRIAGITSNLTFSNCYAAVTTAGFAAVQVAGTHYNMTLDLHVETANALANLELDRTAAVEINGLLLRDTQSQATNIIKSVNSAGTAKIKNGELHIPSIFSGTAKIFAAATGIDFYGRLNIGSSQASLHNLSGLSSFRGEIFTQGTAADCLNNFPASGLVGIYSAGTTTAVFAGSAGTGMQVLGSVIPYTSDVGAIGSATNMWSDLFLASGAVIDFNNGNAVLTHSSGVMNVTTGDLRVTTAGTNAASVVTVDGTQALANKGINGLLATTPPPFMIKITGVNFNAANSDNAIPITLPTGFTRYRVSNPTISHASQTLTTATCGIFTATGGGGTAVVAGGSAITVSTAAESTVNNHQVLGVANSGLISFNVATLYFRVQTAQGAAATADVSVQINPLP